MSVDAFVREQVHCHNRQNKRDYDKRGYRPHENFEFFDFRSKLDLHCSKTPCFLVTAALDRGRHAAEMVSKEHLENIVQCRAAKVKGERRHIIGRSGFLFPNKYDIMLIYRKSP